MRAFLLSLIALVVITVGANLLLNLSGFTAQNANTTGQNVRVGDDG